MPDYGKRTFSLVKQTGIGPQELQNEEGMATHKILNQIIVSSFLCSHSCVLIVHSMANEIHDMTVTCHF